MPRENDFRRVISEYSSFIITTHKSCDGDGLGAGCALGYGLKKIGKKASFITLDVPQDRYKFLNEDEFIQPLPSFPNSKSGLELKKTDCILAVDLNDPSLMEPLYSLAENKGARICFIDHHPLQEKITGHTYFIDTNASSTGEIVYRLLKDLKVPMDERIATGLYSSIVFDTKCFRVVKNSPVPFSIAAELVPHIPDVDRIYENLFKNLTVEKLKFFSHVNGIEYYNNNQVALLHLTENDLEKYKADVGTACDLLDMVMNVSTMQVGVLILERNNSSFKLSIRSRKTNVLPFARALGGGGHKFSAGAYIQNSSYKQIKERIISEFVA